MTQKESGCLFSLLSFRNQTRGAGTSVGGLFLNTVSSIFFFFFFPFVLKFLTILLAVTFAKQCEKIAFQISKTRVS